MSITLVVKYESLVEYIEKKRASLIEVIGQRVDIVNAMLADRLHGNLNGAMLQRRSGKLYDSVMIEASQVSGDEVVGAVSAAGDTAPYGVYFNAGGKGYYTIAPKNARALAFMGEGKMIFAKMVNHPPIPHLPWFDQEIPQAKQDMRDQINAGFNEVLEP